MYSDFISSLFVFDLGGGSLCLAGFGGGDFIGDFDIDGREGVIGIVDGLPESGLSYAAGVFGDVRWLLFIIAFLFFWSYQIFR